MKGILLLYFFLFTTSFIAQNETIGKTILVLFAHPDDETAVAPVIAKLSKENRIILLTALDGRYGIQEHAGNISGDELAKVRRKELECSCKKLGVDSLIQLKYHDGFGMRTNVAEYFRQFKAAREEVYQTINSIKPDLIITFGPDGDTGHADHRIIGNLVTEIILREGWYNKYPIYYLTWTKTQANQLSGLGYVDDKYFTNAISFNDEDESKSWEAIKCHWSQFPQDEIDAWIAHDKQDTSNKLYFRKFTVANGELKEGF